MSETITPKMDAKPAWDGMASTIPAQAQATLPARQGMQRYYPHRSWKWTYPVAVLMALFAFTLRYAIYGDLDARLPFAFFTPAALIAAWYGGVGPAFVAYVIGLILGDLFFLPSHSAFGSIGSSDSIALGVYTLTTAVGVGVIEHLHITIRRMQRATERAQQIANGQ